MPAAHRSARFVAWSHAVRLGTASPDRAAEEITATDPAHRVVGLPGGDPQTLPVVLARLAPTEGPRLALPASGDPLGLPGPGPLTAAAILAGEAVLLPVVGGSAFGLVPSTDRTGTTWQALPLTVPALTEAAPAQLPSLAEADRSLAESVREATELLSKLDLARLDEESEAALGALRAGALDGDGLAPGYPQRAFRVLLLARRLRVIVSVAMRGDGAAVTAGEAAARREVLVTLDRAARHAEAAAYNCVLEPGFTGPDSVTRS